MIKLLKENDELEKGDVILFLDPVTLLPVGTGGLQNKGIMIVTGLAGELVGEAFSLPVIAYRIINK